MIGTMRTINYKIIAAKSDEFKIEFKPKVASALQLKSAYYVENIFVIPDGVSELINWLCKGNHDTYILCKNGIRIPAHKEVLSKNANFESNFEHKMKDQDFIDFARHSVISVLNFIYPLYREEMGILASIKNKRDIKGWSISWHDSHREIKGEIDSVVGGTTFKVNGIDGKPIEAFHIWGENVYSEQWLKGKRVPDHGKLVRVCNFHKERDMPKDADAIGELMYMVDKYFAPREEFEWYLTALKTVYSKPLSINEAIMLLTLSPWKNLRPKYREQLSRFVLGQLETENSARSIGTEIAKRARQSPEQIKDAVDMTEELLCRYGDLLYKEQKEQSDFILMQGIALMAFGIGEEFARNKLTDAAVDIVKMYLTLLNNILRDKKIKFDGSQQSKYMSKIYVAFFAEVAVIGEILVRTHPKKAAVIVRELSEEWESFLECRGANDVIVRTSNGRRRRRRLKACSRLEKILRSAVETLAKHVGVKYLVEIGEKGQRPCICAFSAKLAKMHGYKLAKVIKDVSTDLETFTTARDVKAALKKITSQRKKYDAWLGDGDRIKEEEKAFTEALRATVVSVKKVEEIFPRLAMSLSMYNNETSVYFRWAIVQLELASKIEITLREKLRGIVSRLEKLEDDVDKFYDEENDELFIRLDLYEAFIAFCELISPEDEAIKTYKHKIEILEEKYLESSNQEEVDTVASKTTETKILPRDQYPIALRNRYQKLTTEEAVRLLTFSKYLGPEHREQLYRFVLGQEGGHLTTCDFGTVFAKRAGHSIEQTKDAVDMTEELLCLYGDLLYKEPIEQSDLILMRGIRLLAFGTGKEFARNKLADAAVDIVKMYLTLLNKILRDKKIKFNGSRQSRDMSKIYEIFFTEVAVIGEILVNTHPKKADVIVRELSEEWKSFLEASRSVRRASVPGRRKRRRKATSSPLGKRLVSAVETLAKHVSVKYLVEIGEKEGEALENAVIKEFKTDVLDASMEVDVKPSALKE